MIENFSFYLALVVAMILLIMLANRIKVAYPILLVLAGLAFSFIPGIPVLKIPPDLIFIIFLPPLLFEAAWNISWKELWRWRRIVLSFAFLLVFLTALSVAFVANHFIPGFTLALGFLLGGIVSPPDAVSVAAILKFVKVPKRMAIILEGESLLNDASSLIILRFALAAVATGQFVWYQAAGSLVWMVIAGCGIGVLIGWIFMKAHKYLPTNADTDSLLTIVAPFIMYIAAEEVHASGVLAVVSGGLLLSTNRHSFLATGSLIRGINVWQSIAFLLNGMVFMLIGLALPEIIAGMQQVSLWSAIGYGLLITAVLMVVRILAAYGAVIVTMIMRNFIKVADDKNPGYKAPLVMGWAGMRGVVSLAAALSIPITLDNGQSFPQRNLILFITFVVIITTLLLQGLTLPVIIKKIKLPVFDDHLSEDETVKKIRRGLVMNSASYLKEKYPQEIAENTVLQELVQAWNIKTEHDKNPDMPKFLVVIYRDVLKHQREWLVQEYKNNEELDEEAVRRYLYRLILEDEKMRIS